MPRVDFQTKTQMTSRASEPYKRVVAAVYAFNDWRFLNVILYNPAIYSKITQD